MRKRMLMAAALILVVLAGCSSVTPMMTCCLDAQKIVAFYSEEPPTGEEPGKYLVNWIEYHPYGQMCVGWPDQPTEGGHVECFAIYDMKDPMEICAAREIMGVPLSSPVWTPEGQAIYPPCDLE